jgi:hypothetical protein
MGHNELDGTTHVPRFGVTHLAFLGSDHRTTCLSEQLEKRKFACAIKEEGLCIEYIYCQESIVEVLAQSHIFIIDLRNRRIDVKRDREKIGIHHRR